MSDELLPAQEELLQLLIEAAEKLPRHEQEFTLLSGDDQGKAVVVAAGGFRTDVLRNDIWILDQNDYISGQWNVSPEVPVPFTVTKKGHDWYAGYSGDIRADPSGPYYHVRVAPVSAREKLNGPVYAVDLSEERMLLDFIEPFQQSLAIEWGDRRLDGGDYMKPKITRTPGSGVAAVKKIRANLAKNARSHSVNQAEELFFRKASEDVSDEYVVAASARASGDRPSGQGEGIFIVHGHKRRDEVARYVERSTGREAIILDEKAGKGRTLIEKVLDESRDAVYAVVLLTADDEARQIGTKEDLQPRARQNAVLELGFFIGYLGRERVAVLYDNGVELPSDMRGVEYIGLAANWKHDLAVELKAAGISGSMA